MKPICHLILQQLSLLKAMHISIFTRNYFGFISIKPQLYLNFIPAKPSKIPDIFIFARDYFFPLLFTKPVAAISLRTNLPKISNKHYHTYKVSSLLYFIYNPNYSFFTPAQPSKSHKHHHT